MDAAEQVFAFGDARLRALPRWLSSGDADRNHAW
jgi:hypothetical protein